MSLSTPIETARADFVEGVSSFVADPAALTKVLCLVPDNAAISH
jgi:hypothetical protein